MDRESFDRLLLEHLSAAQRFAIRLTGDPCLAEDVLHDAILRAMRACEGFRGQARFTTWLFQIVVNCFRDRLKVRVVDELDAEIADGRVLNPSSGADEGELSRLIADRVSSLPPRQREVLALVAFEQMEVREVSEILEISEVSVRVNLCHARERLKRELVRYM